MASLVTDELWRESSWLYMASALWVCSVVWRRNGWHVEMDIVRAGIESFMQEHEREGPTPRHLKVLLNRLPVNKLEELQHTPLYACFGCGQEGVPTWPHPSQRGSFEERWCASCWQSWSQQWD